MNTPNDKTPHSDLERELYEADRYIDSLFPQTPEEVAEAEMLFGSTEVELPEKLRSSKMVFDSIVAKEKAKKESAAFGNMLRMLRTESKLSIQALAKRTDLDPLELEEIESGNCKAISPLVVSVIARHFKLATQKLSQIANLTRPSAVNDCDDALFIAACAKPEFDQLSSDEIKVFRLWLKNHKS
jgi:transcriptional regulator with XRE-family HTH domain